MAVPAPTRITSAAVVSTVVRRSDDVAPSPERRPGGGVAVSGAPSSSGAGPLIRPSPIFRDAPKVVARPRGIRHRAAHLLCDRKSGPRQVDLGVEPREPKR